MRNPQAAPNGPRFANIGYNVYSFDCHLITGALVGPTRKGHLWETTAVPEIRQQAEQLAQHLLKAPLRRHAQDQDDLLEPAV